MLVLFESASGYYIFKVNTIKIYKPSENVFIYVLLIVLFVLFWFRSTMKES